MTFACMTNFRPIRPTHAETCTRAHSNLATPLDRPTELSRVYTRQYVARQHVAFNMLLVAGNMLPGNMLPGVNAALPSQWQNTAALLPVPNSTTCCQVQVCDNKTTGSHRRKLLLSY